MSFDAFKNTPYIVAHDIYGFVYILDSRISLPIYRSEQIDCRYVKCFESSKNLLFAACGYDSTQIIDASVQMSLMTINKSIDCFIPLRNKKAFLLDQSGTFLIDINSPEKSFSFNDGNRIDTIPFKQEGLQTDRLYVRIF